MELLVIMLIGAILNGLLASSRGRSAVVWALVGALFPLVSLLILVILPNLSATQTSDAKLAEAEHKLRLAEIRAEQTADRGKVCPMCAETVKSAAKVCRFCGHQFPDEVKQEARPKEEPIDPNVAERGVYLGVPYTRFVDGTVTAIIDDEVKTWPTQERFRYTVYVISRGMGGQAI